MKNRLLPLLIILSACNYFSLGDSNSHLEVDACGTFDAAIDTAPDSPPPAVYLDPTSGIYVPQSVSEWTNLAITGVGDPSHMWLLQETSGSLVDTVGGATLLKGGIQQSNLFYQQTVPGWTTRAIGTGYSQQSAYWYSVHSSLPDLATTSQTYLLYWRFVSAPAVRAHISLNGYAGTGGGALQLRSDPDCRPMEYIGTTLGKMPTSHCDGNVHALVVTFDRNGVMALATDIERKLETFPTSLPPAGKEFMLGGAQNLEQQFLAAYAWDGVAGEMSAQTQWDLINGLGFSPAWSRP